MKGNRSVWESQAPSDLRRGFASRATPEVTVENRPFSLQKPTPMGDMATMYNVPTKTRKRFLSAQWI